MCVRVYARMCGLMIECPAEQKRRANATARRRPRVVPFAALPLCL